MPIRIMHVVDSLGRGGLENGLVNVIRNMDSERFDHIVLAIRALGPNAERLRSGRARIECLEKHDGSRSQLLQILQAIRKFRPDIVHSRNWGGIEAGFAVRCERSCAVVHSEHGVESDASKKEPWRRTWLRRLAFELANQVFSVSYQLRDLHSRRTGFSAQRIAVIHNGVDSRQFFPDKGVRARVRDELGIGPGDFCVGGVGNLLPVKDHITLLRAIRQFAAGRTNWRLLLIGEGSERPKLEAYIRANPDLRDRVWLMGSSSRVPELLTAMDVYVLSSVAEGISNSLLEAMAAGLPVVATATGGNPEVVVDGESGLLFPVRECATLAGHLKLLATDSDARERFSRQAIQRIRDHFSVDSMIRKYERLYETVAAEG